jgi:putative membrane protein
MMFGYDNGVGWGGWILMALVMVAFWGLVIYGILALFRSGSTSGSRIDSAPADPRRILDERFARGEIELEEYQSRRDALVDGTSSGRRWSVRPGARPR